MGRMSRRTGSGRRTKSVKTIVEKQRGKDETTAKELQNLLDGHGHKLPCYRAAISVLPFPCFLPIIILLSCFRVSVLLLFRCLVITNPLLRAYRAMETKH